MYVKGDVYFDGSNVFYERLAAAFAVGDSVYLVGLRVVPNLAVR